VPVTSTFKTAVTLCLLVQPNRFATSFQPSEWTNSTTCTYNVTLADMRLHNPLWIYVRNSDGIDLDSSWAGDLQYSFRQMDVSDGRLPAKIIQLTMEYANNNSVVPGPETTPLPVGTTVRFVVVGEDPKGLPLQYAFQLYRRCKGSAFKQDWSSSNTFEHTLAPEDVTFCTSFVRNSDGWAHYPYWSPEYGADYSVRSSCKTLHLTLQNCS
jgi:hypothetical protein